MTISPHDTELERAEAAVLNELQYFATLGGVCWANIKSIARRCRYSKRHVSRMISSLINKGRIECEAWFEPTARGRHRQTSNRIRIVPHDTVARLKGLLDKKKKKESSSRGKWVAMKTRMQPKRASGISQSMRDAWIQMNKDAGLPWDAGWSWDAAG